MKSFLRILFLSTLLTAAAVLSACVKDPVPSVTPSSGEVTATPTEASSEETEPETEPAPSFTAVDLSGNEVTDAIFSGHKLTMVNIWGTYCGPCIREMPELGKLSAEYADKGVQIIGIICDSVDYTYQPVDSVLTTAQSIIMQTGANYRHLVLSESLSTRFMQGVTAVPTTFFVDETGETIGEAVIGSRSYEQWKAVFEKLLSEAE